MNLQLIGGLALMFFGGILFRGEKSLALHNPPLGVLIIGMGFLLAVYAYFTSDEQSSSGKRQKVKDRFV